jgi:hypothetical protein
MGFLPTNINGFQNGMFRLLNGRDGNEGSWTALKFLRC